MSIIKPLLKANQHLTECPCCNNFFDIGIVIGSDKPVEHKTGDLCVCSYCYEILTWNYMMNLERLSSDRWQKLTKQQQIDLNNLVYIARNSH